MSVTSVNAQQNCSMAQQAPPAAIDASGGGAVAASTSTPSQATAGVEALLAQIMQLLQQMIATLQAQQGAAQVGGGAAAPTGGASQQTQLPPTQVTTPATLTTAGQSAPKDAFTTTSTIQGDGRTKNLHQRTAPEDRALAARNLQIMMNAAPKTVAELIAKGYRPAGIDKAANAMWTERINQGYVPTAADKVPTHWSIPKNLRNDPNQKGVLEQPEMYMLEKGKITGVVFTVWTGQGATLPDFGMGGWHDHAGGATWMQHVMFEPNNLDAAFGDGQAHMHGA